MNISYFLRIVKNAFFLFFLPLCCFATTHQLMHFIPLTNQNKMNVCAQPAYCLPLSGWTTNAFILCRKVLWQSFKSSPLGFISVRLISLQMVRDDTIRNSNGYLLAPYQACSGEFNSVPLQIAISVASVGCKDTAKGACRWSGHTTAVWNAGSCLILADEVPSLPLIATLLCPPSPVMSLPNAPSNKL